MPKKAMGVHPSALFSHSVSSNSRLVLEWRLSAGSWVRSGVSVHWLMRLLWEFTHWVYIFTHRFRAVSIWTSSTTTLFLGDSLWSGYPCGASSIISHSCFAANGFWTFFACYFTVGFWQPKSCRIGEAYGNENSKES